jgi:hypothetical protein
MTDEQLSALLRLKRYEQPPAQYFDRLLQDIHRRQRAELLQRPLWKIAVERVQTFFSEHSMGHLSYAGALATVLVVGVAGIGLMTPAVENAGPSAALASNKAPAPATSPFSEKSLSLAQTSPPAPVLESLSVPVAQPGYESVVSQPRYIIDARPVSYEPSTSINF